MNTTTEHEKDSSIGHLQDQNLLYVSETLNYRQSSTGLQARASTEKTKGEGKIFSGVIRQSLKGSAAVSLGQSPSCQKQGGLGEGRTPKTWRFSNFFSKNNAYLGHIYFIDLKSSLKQPFGLPKNTLMIALMDQWVGERQIALKIYLHRTEKFKCLALKLNF